MYGGISYSNTSIFYAFDPNDPSGNSVLVALTDGGVPDDDDYEDLVIRISLPGS
jgi:hypothetical protein